MKDEIPTTPILVNSVLVVKATAALSEKILKELEDKSEEKDLKELINAQDRRNQ